MDSTSVIETLDPDVLNHSDLKRALDEFIVSSQLRPLSISTYIKLGLSLHDQCFYESAIKVFQAAINLDNECLLALNYSGSSLFELGKFDEAVENFNKAISINEIDPESHLNLARAFRHTSRTNEALKVCQKALQLDSNLFSSHVCMTDLLFMQGKNEEARKAFDIATSLCHVFQRDHGQSQGDEEENKDQFTALELDNSNIVSNRKWLFLYFRLACSLKDQKIIEKAEKICNHIIQTHLRSFAAYETLAYLYGTQGDNEKAINLYTTTIKLNPDHYLSYYNLGTSYRKVRKIREAILSFEKAANLNPRHFSAFYNLGHILKEQNRLDEAEVAYQTAITVDSTRATAYYNLGLIYNNKKQHRNAIKAFQNVSKLNSKIEFTYLHLANNFKEQNDLNNSLYFMNKSIQMGSKLTGFKQTRDDISKTIEKYDYITELEI